MSPDAPPPPNRAEIMALVRAAHLSGKRKIAAYNDTFGQPALAVALGIVTPDEIAAAMAERKFG